MPKSCVIYCRVSTEKQGRHGESLETQERNCRTFAKRNGYDIKKVFIESYSGRKGGRPVFATMLKYIAENKGDINYLIFSDIDRLTRQGSSAYEAIKERVQIYGVELIDIFGLIQPSVNTLAHTGFEYEWSMVSPTAMAEKFKADVAQDEVRRILTRTVGAAIQFTKQGYYLRGAPDGYLNKKIFAEGKKRSILVPDTERAKYIRLMFEWRASGKFSDDEICRKINAMGYRTRVLNRWDKSRSVIIGKSGGKTLGVKQLQRLIKKPIYCGVICEKWTDKKPIPAQFKGLVDLRTYNTANRGKPYIVQQLDGSLKFTKESKLKSVKKRCKHNPDFPYKTVVRCSECNKPYMGSYSKGKLGKRYGFYHCDRGHRYIGIAKQRLESDLENFLKQIKYKKGFIEVLERLLLKKYRERQREVVQLASDVSKNISELEAKKARVIEKILSVESDVVRKELESRVENLQQEVFEAREQRQQIEITEDDIHAFIGFSRKLIENPAEMLLSCENFTIREMLFGLVFETLPTHQELVNGTPKMSLVFELSESFNNGKLPLVGLTGLCWNPLKNIVIHWLKTFRTVNWLMNEVI